MGSAAALAPLVPLARVSPDPFREDHPASCVPEAPHPSLGPARPLSWIVPPDAHVWPANCEAQEELCAVLRRVAVNREVMVAVANSAAPGLDAFLESLKALSIPNFLVVAIDTALAQRLNASGVPYYYVANPAQGNHKVSAQKFSLLKAFVSVGASVLLTDTDVVYLSNPFAALHRDSDVESMSDGWDAQTAFGWLDAVDDPALGARAPLRRGWTLRAAALNSGLWYVTATRPTLALMAVMEYRLAREDLWDQSGYNMELFLPTHDEHVAARASVRVMSPLCFVNSKVLYRVMRFQARLRDFRPIAIHVNYHADKQHKMALAVEQYLKGVSGALDRCQGDGCSREVANVSALEAGARAGVNDGFVGSHSWGVARQAALRHGCAPRAAWDGKLGADVAFPLPGRIPEPPPGGALPCPDGAQALCAALASALQRLPRGAPAELMLVVADSDGAATLPLLLRSAEVQGLSSRLVVVTLDEAAGRAVASQPSVAHARLDAAAGPLRADAAGAPLRPAAVKWACAAVALRLGVSLLLADPDTLLLGDPFSALYRDADVEAQADGWDEVSAWGYDHVVDDPQMGWSRYCHGTRMSTRDPGLALVQATQAGALLAERVARRLAWRDASGGAAGQASEREVFNQETWLPSHGAYQAVGVSLRAMNFLCFTNSKALLRFGRLDAELTRQSFTPRVVRLSYHSHKAELMAAMMEEFGRPRRKGALQAALKAAQAQGGGGGSLPRACALPEGSAHRLSAAEAQSSALALALRGRPTWSWAGTTPFTFSPDGQLQTPWGTGVWGLLPGEERGAFADFAGAHVVLEFEDHGAGVDTFVSTRCSDGDLVVGRPFTAAAT